MKYTTGTVFIFRLYLKKNKQKKSKKKPKQPNPSFPLKFPAISTVPPRQQECHYNICFLGVLDMEPVNLQDPFCWWARTARVKHCFWQWWLNTFNTEFLETTPESRSLFTTLIFLHIGCQDWEFSFCLTTGIAWSKAIRLEYGYDLFVILFK